VYHDLGGFCIEEVGISNSKRLWLRGSFPRSYLARSLEASDEWRRGFVRTFLERDLPQLGIAINAVTLRRFWAMLAHYHGQVWNAAEFARSFGVSDSTVRRYLDLLTSALVVRQLLPWHENISKRQVKSPKVYLVDSGLLHTLLNVRTMDDLQVHPRSAPPGKDLSWNRSSGAYGPGRSNAFSGQRIPAPNWICWSFTAGSAWALKSS